MEKNFSKRITALSAALAIIAGSAVSCGKKAEAKDEKKTSQQLMAASYRAEMLDTGIECDNVSSMAKLDDGRVFINTKNYGSTTPSFYIADAAMTTFEEVKIDLGIKEDEDVSTIADLAPDGNVVVMATFTDYGDMEKPNYDDPNFDPEKYDFDALRKNIKYTYKLYTVDLEGKVLAENDIKGLDDYAREEGGLSIGDFCPCSGGKAILTIYGDMDQSYVALNSDGSFDQEIKLDDFNWISRFMNVDKDTIAVMGGTTKGSNALFLNADSFEKVDSGMDFTDLGYADINGLFVGNDEYKYFMSTDKGISGIDKDGKATEIINWVDSDMGSGYVSSFIPVGNDEYVIYYSEYMSDSGNGFYKLTKRDASELENVKVITIATLYDDWQVNSKVTAFNKSHDGVRFKVQDYSKYDDYDIGENGQVSVNNMGITQLKKDIGSGNAPDIIVSYDTGLFDSLYNKGLFVDLYEYMDKDPDLSKDKILPNVLQACEKNGKLYYLSPSFTVNTLAAKKSNCDKENWTIDEMIEAYDKLPDGMKLIGSDTKESMLDMTTAMIADAIDYDKGTCSFDTPEFRKLLSFIDKFPASKDLEDEDEENYYGGEDVKNNKTLLEMMYIYDFESYTQELRGNFENNISFVGFPSSDGRGGVLSINQSIGISVKSENKDECWEFFKTFFEEPDEDDESHGMGGFSSLKSAFDKAAEKSMKKPTYKDENGKMVEQDLTIYSNGKQTKIDPLNEKEKDFIVDYILNTTKINGSVDPDVSMIIYEEIMAYINGEKKADEIIDLLQNRISLLVSEQS